MSKSLSVDKAEVNKFSELAEDWWNVNGAMKPLHKLNSARVEFLVEEVCKHLSGKTRRDCMTGVSVLDVGCGAGIFCEAVARLGAKVTGLDVSGDVLKVAKEHAREGGLKIEYVLSSVEDYVGSGKKFDVVSLLEIVEHSADHVSLISASASLLKPGGIMLISTVNQTVKGYLMGVLLAEHILKWVPVGTHDWFRFKRPSDLVEVLEGEGVRIGRISGMVYNPIKDGFDLQDGKIGVNYIMSALA